MARPSKADIAKGILALSQKRTGSQLAKSIAAYFANERRSSELDAVMREISRLREQQTGIVEATVTSAIPLDQKNEHHIRQLLGNKVIINNVIDKSIIGGVRLETSNLSLDLTVRNRLNKLKIGATN